MNRLTRIYTKTGDDGTTAIANNERVYKTSPLIEAIGTVDEANSAIGMCEVHTEAIMRIQDDLFDLGAELSGSKSISITPERIKWLEEQIDYMNQGLEPLEAFILPTGPIHLARSVVRRAERCVWMAISIHEHNDDMTISRVIPQYLNRLSDLLFVMARYYSLKEETLWNVNKYKGGKSEAKNEYTI